MIKEVFTKIVNCMTPGSGVPVLWRGHIVNMQYFLNQIIHMLNETCYGKIIFVNGLSKNSSLYHTNSVDYKTSICTL